MDHIEQGSQEWHEQRLGKVTASRFKDMMTNGRGSGTMGKTAYSYMYDLITEELTGRPQDTIDNKAVQWGNDNEPQARAMYCLLRDARVQQTGFLQHPTLERVGGSPDGLVEDAKDGPGGVEIKCPMNSRIHLTYLENGGVPDAYIWQVQGLMWITGRTWWDFCSFDPRMPDVLQLFVHREMADKEMHQELSDRAERFIEQLQIKLAKIRSRA